MPFTFAHPAIILPLKHLPKRWYSITGLIIGSMTPDFEYFIRMRVKAIYGHSVVGLFYFDLPLGLLLTFIYLFVVKDKLIDHLPIQLNSRFLAYKKKLLKISFATVFIIGLSVIAGAASHILWDSFTHSSGYFVRLFPFLSAVVVQLGRQPIYCYSLLQHGSTLAGLAFIGYTIWGLPKSAVTSAGNVFKYWLIVFLTSVFTVIVRLSFKSHDSYLFGNLLVTAIAGGLIGLVIASAFDSGLQKKL
ncbi:DUF4184 family protein [Mucilaginibacter sp. AW1-7]|uniref:DUF4184 family protein n=1 Tax=unclassified Mucilaginibacter TaxID=2617802 RepID=UPI0023659123|nr:DUF4184 family protein [Mucilaginibacter sp. KACC 22773]WDF79786.1 DUF4184 family protein [Mucilaginibacter sp. KACC 22773]